MNNHVIDPTYFYDAIELFAFNYTWYANNGTSVDSLGRRVNSYDKRIIRGSLQTQGTSLRQNISLNTESNQYNFYCRSTFRIQINDFVEYKGKWLHVDSVHDYDEWGVRSCTMSMINLSQYRDFEEYLNYINGKIIV